MLTLGDKIDRLTGVSAIAAALQADPADDTHFVPVPRPNPAGPFPNLRCREIVKGIVDAVVETTASVKLNDDQAYWFTLGIIRGARIVAQEDDNSEAERFVLTLLDTFNKRGVPAVRELVETVTGRELPGAAD